MTTDLTPARRIAAHADASGVRPLGPHEDDSAPDQHADDALLPIVRSARDLSAASTELLEAAIAAGSLHRRHVDPSRANVLRALALPREARVLEIGAGYGAITRYLGETVAVVDALETEHARAAVARERTRDLANVEVFAGVLADLPAEPAYDVIVMVDVLEHVGHGSADRAPYVAFLREAASRLATGGRIVLAIENKLGVKYLAGAPDDHTGRLFDGLEDYPRGTGARSFSRAELLVLLEQAGLTSRTLGAFPDHTSARVVLDFDDVPDAATELLHRIPSFPSPDTAGRRVALVDEGLLWRSLVDAGVGRDFANSFVVIATAEAADDALWPSATLARFFSRDRTRDASASTTVWREGDTVRFSRSFAADPSPLISTEMAESEFVAGRAFDEVFVAADDDERRRLLTAWRQLVDASVDAEGVPIDAIPQNVRVEASGALRLIDIEFRSPDVRVEFVIERGVLWLGTQLASTTAPEVWPQYGRIRELVVGLGALAGLDPSGAWVSAAVEAEARFQAEVTTRFAGPDAVGLWQSELDRMLDSDLIAGPLGLRVNDVLNSAEGRLVDLAAELAETEQQLATVTGELTAERAAAEAAVLRLESELLATAQRVTELEIRHQDTEFQLRAAENELGTARSEGARLLHQSQDETFVARSELQALQSSRAFRALAFSRRRLDRLAPWGTHRRGLYERSLRAVGVAARTVRRAPAAVPAPPRFAMPTADVPLVSIVIPIHGKWDFTERCLHSLIRCHNGESFEVIVVDDASPDDSFARLEEFEGVRVVALAQNAGFTRAANAGIRAARGRHVVMLNNDAEVTHGWLDALLDAAELPGAGIVGAKLVYPDGRLQEAGGIIFRDASGWNYGRYGDPNAPEYNFRREVDYCSGAAILITRALLDVVPGFDERYAPAYYEDTDLAFEARRHGLTVVYEPRSTVIHHEGISHGTDEASGTKKYQAINREKFLEKWAVELEGQFENDPSVATVASMRRSGRRTVFIVDHMVPRWREDSGSLRMQRLMTTMIELGYDVVFLPDNRDQAQPYTAELQRLGVLVWYGWGDIWAHLEAIRDVVALVVLSRATVASTYIRHVREVLPDVPLAFDTVDLHFLREQRRLDLAAGGNAKSVHAMRELELAIVRASDLTLVVSEFERSVLQQLEPQKPVYVLSNSHDSVPVSEALPRTEITFVGSFQHNPNADAIRWFVREVFPLVRQQVPSAHLSVVGRFPPSDLLDVPHPGIDYLGWVEDVAPVHARSIVSIAPLRYGAGVKGKVGDAWAHGVPVVMTALAAEGMQVDDGRTGIVADTAEEFAAAVVRLHRDRELWQSISDQSRAHVDRVFGRERLVQALAEILEFQVDDADAAAPGSPGADGPVEWEERPVG
ncbi:glycosyltransferase [Herbiconiux daphne]|uniref:Glycosyltransferase n=1 Tax=Herbiconiux daphne TaxID=2970914 RepID=A0ABT2H4N6_9MICO|nr:glycosyltransferase [Herbiconiux daphne]MCS5734876.1 glycosyltransferase [Herbiconiux daphne]